MSIIYKGKKYKWSCKKLLKNILYGVEFLFVYITYYIIFFNMLVELIKKYN